MDRYLDHVRTWHAALGIAEDYAEVRGLSLQLEAESLVPLGVDVLGRDQFAVASTADAWRQMRDAAAQDGVTLQLVSAFRSVDYQAGLIRRKLDKGLVLDEILRASAAPGYSEHHTGRALDLTTPGGEMLEDSFENTPAFAWLQQHADQYGFSLSFPRDNPQGFIYEPWHWCMLPRRRQITG
ncbi:MAG: M15 family metallopeptidase [Burkholderiales bacterium]|nr:M15 family metallopeptidase [Burkholderiales bacterium]